MSLPEPDAASIAAYAKKLLEETGEEEQEKQQKIRGQILAHLQQIEPSALKQGSKEFGEILVMLYSLLEMLPNLNEMLGDGEAFNEKEALFIYANLQRVKTKVLEYTQKKVLCPREVTKNDVTIGPGKMQIQHKNETYQVAEFWLLSP